MSRNPELDRLKAERQLLFERKQAAFQRFKELQNQTNVAHGAMQLAWEERTHARECMNSEFEARKSAYSHRDSVWNEYGRIRDYNNSRIESLKYRADTEHRAMQNCFEQASNAYQYGNKSEAPYYSQQGHEHKARRDGLNAEISELAREVKQAKAYAEASAPRVDSSAFNHAKAAFELAKARHESAQTEFKRLKSMRDSAKVEFDRLQAQFKQTQAMSQSKLDEVRSERLMAKRRAVDKVNMALVQSNAHYLGTVFGQNAKIVPRRDGSGKIDVYFGGLNAAGDGYGHGHATIDRDGNVTYLRDAWVADKNRDYLINENADKFGGETHKF